MPRKTVVPAAVADALTATKAPPADAKPPAVARAVSVLVGDTPDEISVKDVDTLTTEILALQIQGNRVLLAIGRRLSAAKGKLSHGDWLPWLQSVNIPERLAQRYMKLAREWTANPSILSDLGMSKALALLALPENDRDAFIAEGHVVDGETKSVADMTAKELSDAIRARQDAESKVSVLEARLKESEQDAETQRGELVRANQRLELEQTATAKARAERDAEQKKRFAIADELEKLKNQPVDVAVEKVVDEQAIEAARKEVREKMQADLDFARADADTARKALENAKTSAQQAIDEANAKAETAAKALDEANAAAKQAASDAEKARQELERVKADAKAAPLDDNGLSLFNVLFEQTQAAVNQMHGVLLKTADPEQKAKLQKALLALADIIRKKAET